MRAPGIIKKKVEEYKNPMDELVLNQATQKSKFFCKESDILLLVLTNKLGYGNWIEIKKAVRRENRCRFDHLFISRNEDELKKRVIYLVQSLIKEEEEAKNKGTKDVVGQFLNIDKDLAEMQKKMLEAEEKAMKAFNNIKITVATPE